MKPRPENSHKIVQVSRPELQARYNASCAQLRTIHRRVVLYQLHILFDFVLPEVWRFLFIYFLFYDCTGTVYTACFMKYNYCCC